VSNNSLLFVQLQPGEVAGETLVEQEVGVIDELAPASGRTPEHGGEHDYPDGSFRFGNPPDGDRPANELVRKWLAADSQGGCNSTSHVSMISPTTTKPAKDGADDQRSDDHERLSLEQTAYFDDTHSCAFERAEGHRPVTHQSGQGRDKPQRSATPCQRLSPAGAEGDEKPRRRKQACLTSPWRSGQAPEILVGSTEQRCSDEREHHAFLGLGHARNDCRDGDAPHVSVTSS
jgi:hypothetical protein